MKSENQIKQIAKDIRIKPDADVDERILAFAEAKLAKSTKNQDVAASQRPSIRRTIMKSPITKIAAAAVVSLVVIGGITFWPSHGPDGKQWWLGSSTAWGQEILAVLDGVKAVTCREQTILVDTDGTEHPSSTWDVFYVSRDSYRRDIYDGSVLREIQWYVPDGNGICQHSIRFDLGSYFTHTGEGSFGNYDPIERMRFYVGLLDEADRLLGEDVIDGHQCVGFEISAGKYGNNPPEWTDCIWFDVETKLPVCIEQRGRPVTDQTDKTFTTIQDQFDYNPNMSADTFIPYTPEGFIFGHPDDIQEAGKAAQN